MNDNPLGGLATGQRLGTLPTIPPLLTTAQSAQMRYTVCFRSPWIAQSPDFATQEFLHTLLHGWQGHLHELFSLLDRLGATLTEWTITRTHYEVLLVWFDRTYDLALEPQI